MYKKIMAPLDGSEFSECSLVHVKALACGCQVPEVVLLSVVEQGLGVYVPSDIEKKAQAESTDYLSKLADGLRNDLKKYGVAVKTAVVLGNPAETILDYTDENQVDLIIMSTHGSSGVSRWLLGSVTDKVVRHSPVPVFVISPAGCRVS